MSFPSAPGPRRVPVLTIAMLLLFLAIEFLDELVFGVREAAWPVIRSDLQLDYLQIGVLLSVPAFGSNIIEPFIGVLSDYWRRWVIIIGGGVCFAIALATISLSASYRVLLAGLILLYPASGAFVSLSQAALMDADPMRREQNMARWTFAGSLGVVAGPLVLNLAMRGKMGWQGIFALLALVAVLVAIATWQMRFNPKSGFDDRPGGEPFSWRIGLAGLGRAITNRTAWRWLTLLQFSDLMLDVFLGFLALYFVDVVGSSPAQASIAVAVWAGVGLVGDFLLIPLLEKVAGLTYLRISSVCVSIVPGILANARLTG